MLTKEKLIKAIEKMPESEVAQIDSLLERIVLLNKIDEGLDDINNGRVITLEELKKEVKQWHK
jgi:predicted transcriptional regulator